MTDENINNIPEADDMEDNIIELTDDAGNTERFEYLTTVDHEGELYIVVMPADDSDEELEEGEVLILKIEQDENGDDTYVTVDDEALGQAVFDKFLAMLEEEAEE